VSLAQLPSVAQAGEGVPPSFMSARTGGSVAWVAADGTLHGAPAS
jgi:hypothetical protein